mgnify:CR=1 FL=1
MNAAYLILGALMGMLASLLALVTGTSFPQCLILYPAVGVPSALMFAAVQMLNEIGADRRALHADADHTS